MWKRNRLPFFCALGTVLTVLALAAVFGKGPALPAGSWGLSFPTPGETPVGNASPQQLREYDAAYAGDPEKNILYLTFDAGYEGGCTAQILDVLRAHRVPAAFFLVGTYIEKNPELVRRMVREGHLVGNHTQSHPDMSKITEEAAFARELAQVEEAYRLVTDEEMPRYYRPPQGIYSEENLRLAKSMGYRTVFWSLAYADWDRNSQPSAELAFSKLVGRIHPGAVVLLHSTSTTNAAILDELLCRWEDMGYSFGTLDQLFSQSSL